MYVVQVKADVTEGSDKLAEAIGDDSEAVVCVCCVVVSLKDGGWSGVAGGEKRRWRRNCDGISGRR